MLRGHGGERTAIEDHTLKPKGFCQVLGGLRFACACWTGGCASQHEAECCCEGHVAPVGERCDDQSTAEPCVLIPEAEQACTGARRPAMSSTATFCMQDSTEWEVVRLPSNEVCESDGKDG